MEFGPRLIVAVDYLPNALHIYRAGYYPSKLTFENNAIIIDEVVVVSACKLGK